MNIFYLEWVNKRPSVCEFRNKIPDIYNYHCSLNIRGFKDIFSKIEIYGNIDEELEDYEFSKNLIYKKKSFLISHLQKSIRKMHSEKALKIGKHIIDLDIVSLLRRLPIIMFEDVIPHESIIIIDVVVVVVVVHHSSSSSSSYILLFIFFFIIIIIIIIIIHLLLLHYHLISSIT